MLVWNPETLFRLRAAVGPMVGLNLDPSHLIWMGADPIAVARALGPAIHHVHGKDVRLERGVVEVNGLLETKPIDDVARRARTMSPSAAAGICSGGRSSSRWCA